MNLKSQTAFSVSMVVFQAAFGNWGVGSNWNTGIVPSGLGDAPFIVGNTISQITSAEPSVQNVYVGQGIGNGAVEMTSGSLSADGLYIGRDTGRYGLWYQSGGALDTSYLELAGAGGTQGEFVLMGGGVAGLSNMDVGHYGLGEFTIGGGLLNTGGLDIASQAGSNYSYFSEAAGKVSISGGVNVGSAGYNTVGTLSLSGGNFNWDGNLAVAGNGSAVVMMGNSATAKWTGRSGTALTVGQGGALRFDLTPGGVGTLNLGLGRLDINAGTSLIVDGSQFNLPANQVQTFDLVNSSGMAGQSNFSNVHLMGFEGKSASISYSGGNVLLTISPSVPLSAPVVVQAGTVTLNSQFQYMYAPSAMYDQTEGLYKVWSMYYTNAMASSLPEADHIGYKESPTLGGLANAPTMLAMRPSGNPYYFNQVDAGDPSVYRDPATNIYYMAYDGNTDGSKLQEATRIGIAESFNGGRTFTPLYTNNAAAGYALIAPGPGFVAGNYGVGQPAVAYANDGYWYMIYTDAIGSLNGGGIPDSMQVIRSQSPTFSGYTAVTSLPVSVIGGYSMDMAYDRSTNQFITIANALASNPGNNYSVPIGNNAIRIDWFDSSWHEIRSQTITIDNQQFSFGEGLALLTGSRGGLLNPSLMTFFGATIQQNRPNDPWAFWTVGNFSDLTVALPVSSVPGPATLGIFVIGGLGILIRRSVNRKSCLIC